MFLFSTSSIRVLDTRRQNVEPAHLQIIDLTCLPIFKCYCPDKIYLHVTLTSQRDLELYGMGLTHGTSSQLC